jgi:predicted nucleic acid-binding protein
MIILDTDVLSTLMRGRPDVAVAAQPDRQSAESIWISSITVFESRLGLALLPDGRRWQLLEAALEQIVAVDLDDRVPDVDRGATAAAAALAACRQRAGKPVDMRDTQIAGIAASARATLATRNVRHFANLQVSVVDPWNGP